MSREPVFITRVNVAKGQDFAMVAMGAPVGPLGDGAVQHEEILRVVMSYRTLKEVAELFSRTVKEIEAAAAAAKPTTARTFAIRPEERETGGETEPMKAPAGGVSTAH